MSADEERIALFLDYENLAIGARENLGGMAFDFKPVADALAERGRVVARKAYADWLKFGEDGRMLTRHHVELIEIPQRMGSVRKNAADIKMAVDALELCFERDYITTFVLGTGDSDFTPLVHKLREHNKQVIGLGVQMSTSALLPPACDEFLFYERLEGVEVPTKRRSIVPRGRGGRGRRPQVGDVGEVEVEVEADAGETDAGDTAESTAPSTLEEVEKLITQTLSGLERSSGSVRASSLKRAVLRKESTFSEADYGFRGFTELLRSLADRGVIHLTDSSSPGDPDVQFPSGNDLGEVGGAFELLASTVEGLSRDGGGAPLSGLKTQLRRKQPDFSEKRFGFGGFLQFAKAGVARGVVEMAWSDDADDYLLTAVAGRPTFDPAAAEHDAASARRAASEHTDEPQGAEDGGGRTATPLDAAAEANGNRPPADNGRGRRSRGGRGRGRGVDTGALAEGAERSPDRPAERGDAVERGLSPVDAAPALLDAAAEPGGDVDEVSDRTRVSAAPAAQDAATTAVPGVDTNPATPGEDPAAVAPGGDAPDATGPGAAGGTVTEPEPEAEPAEARPVRAHGTVEQAPVEAGTTEPAIAPARRTRTRLPKATAATVATGAATDTATGGDAVDAVNAPAAPKRRAPAKKRTAAAAAPALDDAAGGGEAAAAGGGEAAAAGGGEAAAAGGGEAAAAPKPARKAAAPRRRRSATSDAATGADVTATSSGAGEADGA